VQSGAIGRWGIVVAVAITAPRPPALAQQGQGASAAAGPAVNLLRAGPPGSTGLGPIDIVASPPDTFPKELVPASAAVAAVGVSGPSTVVVGLLSAAPFDSIRFVWTLEDAGWTRMTPVRAGFLPAGPPLATTMCRTGTFATISLLTGVGTDRYIRIAAGPNPQRSCAPVGNLRPLSDVPIPLLELPPGTRTSGAGGGGSFDEIESWIRLENSAGVAALAAHFIPQLTDAGWTVVGGSVGDGALSVTRLTSRSKAGDPVTAVLTFVALDGTPSIEAVLHVIRNKPSRGPTMADE
jgi:hypothetical protein